MVRLAGQTLIYLYFFFLIQNFYVLTLNQIHVTLSAQKNLNRIQRNGEPKKMDKPNLQ